MLPVLFQFFVIAVAALTSAVVVIAHMVGLSFYWEKSPVMTIFLVIFGYWLLINVTFHYVMAVFTPPGHPPDVSDYSTLMSEEIRKFEAT